MQATTAILSFLFSLLATTTVTLRPPLTSLLPSDAVPILSFKSKADSDNKLLYTLHEHFDYCQWQGVVCSQGRVIRVVLQNFGLRGTFSPNTLTRLDQLRVLNLNNNSLSGPVPDLSGLINLKSLFLNHNLFSGSFPDSLFGLHRIRAIELSYNDFTGLISGEITCLDRLSSLRLELNRFNGSVPALNQTSLTVFNVSGNNFTGPIPITPVLSRFDESSFSRNPSLCGVILNKDCHSSTPFFESSVTVPPPSKPAIQNVGVIVLSPPSPKNHKRTGLILGFLIGTVFLISSVLFLFALFRNRTTCRNSNPKLADSDSDSSILTTAVPTTTLEVVEERVVMESSVKKVEEIQRVKKSGSLVFCEGESQAYTLEQLMRASAELLGRGSLGTTYKAVLDNQLIVTVKRVDAIKTAITSGEVFERHMDAVGCLRHPNLVPMRSYFQAKEEKLIVYDYQPNGSLFNLIHGSRSSRAKPLHWTSCLKIAEDVAQGLAYIHQASKFVHGNLKSTNVLLGSDFEACLTDYCLSILAQTPPNDDPDSAPYKAPETRKSSLHATTQKSDVFSLGILLLELLTGRRPSQHPFLLPTDVPNWVRAMRDDDGSEDNRLGMLVEVASVCSLTSPEQRPAMRQVLKMINEIKESVVMEPHTIDVSTGSS